MQRNCFLNMPVKVKVTCLSGKVPKSKPGGEGQLEHPDPATECGLRLSTSWPLQVPQWRAGPSRWIEISVLGSPLVLPITRCVTPNKSNSSVSPNEALSFVQQTQGDTSVGRKLISQTPCTQIFRQLTGKYRDSLLPDLSALP